MSARQLDVVTVRQAAQGRWHTILPALSIRVPDHPKKHGPCPACGGKDRFRLDDRDGLGTWFCNQCEPHAGDGFALVMRAAGLPFREALGAVAGVLGLDPAHSSQPRRPLPPPPAPIDRWGRAFQLELGALDRRLRAERILTAARTHTGDELPDDLRDRLMAAVGAAYDDLAHAARLERSADVLRVRAIAEQRRRP